MKEVNVNSKNKRSGLFVQGITALSLSLALQGRACHSGGTYNYTLNHTNDNQFLKEIEDRKDISKTDETGKNWLYVAVEHNDLQKVKGIVARINKDLEDHASHSDPNFPNSYNTSSKTTALGIAIINGYTEIVKLLATCPYIDINKATTTSKSLFVALSRGKKNIAGILLKHPKIKIGEKDLPSGAYPLHLAIEKKFEDITLLLIDKLPEEGLKVKNKKLETPLYLATKHGLNTVVTRLVSKLTTLNDFYVMDQKGKGLLHIAARDNNQNAFKALFEKICSLSNKTTAITKLFDKDKKGYTVLASAYLPKHIKQKWVHIPNENRNMFKIVLWAVKDNLNRNQWAIITNEINVLENNGTIKKGYADILRGIVDSIASSGGAASA
ncbi:ankyrin repeat domain-containing protein [Cardinium endosymbiont of Oedothorax gibbosus]|uniref:ankyrin repeat domain-containing protein n=1 Tax=Cardinium endosymbiont of Oedothorax gibbosus TaxID=931101 RepID=UPI00202437C3|nr:ankyrin repeat domain-containing protein [Cardinium endosymbiont of Oedothorax gibbosus]CAH2560225.1 Ankyrin-repeat-containing protein [Cardinium endosymbiont of Oedothorax gibbosus]